MDVIEEIRNVLGFTLFSFNEQTVTVAQILLVPLVLLFGYFITSRFKRLLVRKLAEREFDPDLMLLIDRLFMIVAMALLIMFCLSLLNVPLTAFAFVSGALAIGIGFGAQNILNNFISGWILMWERPIRIGDFLEIGDAKGRVETINTRSTRFRRVDGVHMLIPNSQLLETTVVNWTLIDNVVRGVVRVGVAYGSPVKLVAQLIEQVAHDLDDILAEPKPLVIFEDFGDNALIFDLYFWIEAVGERDLRVIRSNVRFAIVELFDQNGIIVAYPQRDIHVDGELKLMQTAPALKAVEQAPATAADTSDDPSPGSSGTA